MIVTIAAAMALGTQNVSRQPINTPKDSLGVAVLNESPRNVIDTELPPRINELVELAWSQAKADAQAKGLPNQKDIDSDKALGKEYSQEVEKELKISKNEEYAARLKKVSEPIIKVAQTMQVKVSWGDPRLSPFDYQIKVVEGDQVNAFSLPGGYIYFYEGLMKYIESDDELAGVIGHEISHASFRHLATLTKEQSKFDLLTLPLILITIMSGGKSGTEALTLAQLANQATSSGWGQKAELAADYGSFQYLQHTPYSPVGLLTFLERLARDQRALEAIDWGIYRTHPPSRERAEKITAYLQAANIPIRRSAVSTSFRVTFKEADKGKYEAYFNKTKLFSMAGNDAADRANRAARQLNDFFDQVPELYEVTLSDSGEIRGRNRLLVSLDRDDATAMGTSLSAAREEALRAIKKSLFFYAYRIWDAR